MKASKAVFQMLSKIYVAAFLKLVGNKKTLTIFVKKLLQRILVESQMRHWSPIDKLRIDETNVDFPISETRCHTDDYLRIISKKS